MPLSEDRLVLVPEEDLGTPELTLKRAPWVLGRMALMGLDSYFPQVSGVSSLWTPLQAAMSVLYWMVFWWILPPGWEPNLVSLAPLSHKILPFWKPGPGSRNQTLILDPLGRQACGPQDRLPKFFWD
ncbi:hypothetical protein DSO57_1011346 [Entomophthora muscae]|uniref:Uncharacterized protein n=1 Tax=Entomophthora muscae TaxID=34485 RepID=A0ACC2U5P9_9FUNG|nr:hypothetical protein DSO57_1011346 [Entomophthora muscae]